MSQSHKQVLWFVGEKVVCVHNASLFADQQCGFYAH